MHPVVQRHAELVGHLMAEMADTGEMMRIPATGRSFECVTPNIARFAGGRAVAHWADQGMFQFLTLIGAGRRRRPPADAALQ